MKERVADYIARRCVDFGITHVFMVTGGGAMHLNDAFGRNASLQKIFFHHEQAAAMAADSYFRLSNRPCVVNVTTGPGGINALNGVYGAYVDSLAMVVISGQVKRETYGPNWPVPLRQLGDQEADIVKMSQPILKYGVVLQDPKEVRRELEKAFYFAREGRPGPVWIDIPIDVQGAMIDGDALAGFELGDISHQLSGVAENTRHSLGRMTSEQIEDACRTIVARLKHAQRPVLFAGAGIRLAGVRSGFLSLTERIGVPVVTGWNAHDILPNNHPCYAGRPGTIGDRAGNFTVQNADFLLILGSRLNIRQVSYNWKNFASRAWKTAVDVDLAELQKPTLAIDLPIHADLRDFLPALDAALADYVPSKAQENYLSWCKERVERYPAIPPLNPDRSAVNPYHFMRELFALTDENEIVVTGDGTACVASFQAATLKQRQRLYTNSGSASMGYDLPAAIGAHHASGGRRIICLAGDGSIMMNLQELQTIIGMALPIKIVILNNQGYHSIRQTQAAYFSDNEVGVGPNSGVTFPDFMKLCTAFGLPTERCAIPATMSAAIERLLATEGPAVLEVILDIEQPFEPKLASRRLPDGTMLTPELDDMSPFLSRQEMAENRLDD